MVSRPYFTHSVLLCDTAPHSHHISTYSGEIHYRCPLNTISTLPRPITSRIRGCHCCLACHTAWCQWVPSHPPPPFLQLFCGCPVAPRKLSLDARLAVCDCASSRAPTSSWTVHHLCQVSLRCRRAVGILPHQHIACRQSTTRITLSAFPVACSLPYLAYCVHPWG